MVLPDGLVLLNATSTAKSHVKKLCFVVTMFEFCNGSSNNKNTNNSNNKKAPIFLVKILFYFLQQL